MKPLGKSSRTLRRTLLAIVIFALSFMIYYPVAQRPVYARDSLRNFFNYGLAIALLVTFLSSVLEDSETWGFIFGNILNWGLVFGYHFFFGYPYWLIVLYLIGGGLFFGFIYFFVAAVFCGFSIPPRKCSNCGKKGFFLRTQYCHACGREGCDHCMMPLFRFDSRFLSERVVVCSESCWENFFREIEAIIHKNMSEAWSAKEKPAEYDGDEGRHVNEALIRAYLSYAQENPNYPYKELVERQLKKVQERSKLHENVEITWYYNSKKYEESKNPYRDFFPQNQARRAKHGFSRQYERIPYKYEVAFEGDLEDRDSSEFLFTKLVFSRLYKQEELGGPSKDKALTAIARKGMEVIHRERREMVRERIEEARKRRKWYEVRAQDIGVCDWCNEKLKEHNGETAYWRCPHGEDFLEPCHTIFCSKRCLYSHLHNVHDE